MSIKDSYDFQNLVNETERLVLEHLEKELQKDYAKDFCKCQECVLDMAAYALNSLKPVYRVSLLGKLYAHNLDDTEYGEEVSSAVRKAVLKIAENPSHD
ncbi:MAG: competence protein ComFB [Spirochaetes bacterium]|nr:MAG: competence protein ComFB [Spirochaetota bacterium]